jgi:hypothetical protein
LDGREATEALLAGTAAQGSPLQQDMALKSEIEFMQRSRGRKVSHGADHSQGSMQEQPDASKWHTLLMAGNQAYKEYVL